MRPIECLQPSEIERLTVTGWARGWPGAGHPKGAAADRRGLQVFALPIREVRVWEFEGEIRAYSCFKRGVTYGQAAY